MGKRVSFSGSGVELPWWSLRAATVDRTFYKDALCRQEKVIPRISWTAEIKRSYEIEGQKHSGYSLIKMACTICKDCPVQWECARAAINGEELVGTWSDRIENIKWLSRQPDWEKSMAAAEKANVPVQTLIAMLKQHK